MKISLNKDEMLLVVRKSYPKEMIPEGYEIQEIKEEGYSYDKQWTITLLPKEKEEEKEGS